MNVLGFVDGVGIYGNYIHFAFVVFFVGSAFLVFIYLWKKGRLDWDEEAKYQFMNQEEDKWKKDK